MDQSSRTALTSISRTRAGRRKRFKERMRGMSSRCHMDRSQSCASRCGFSLDSLGPELRAEFSGVYIANKGFTVGSARARLNRWVADALACSKAFIPDPDLLSRSCIRAPLSSLVPATIDTPESGLHRLPIGVRGRTWGGLGALPQSDSAPGTIWELTHLISPSLSAPSQPIPLWRRYESSRSALKQPINFTPRRPDLAPLILHNPPW